MKIVVTGATGFIGKALVSKLRERGDHVVALVRNVEKAKSLGVELVQSDLESAGSLSSAIAGADAIIHLAGAPVAGKRWDSRVKQEIRDSRVETTRTLVEAIGKLDKKPGALVVASGIDYYPFALDTTDFDDDEVTEADAPADTFLGRVCRDWEREAQGATKLGVRVVNMRTGLVLGKTGGALHELRKPFQFFVGGRIGSGRQWMSWIHLDDVVNAYLAAATDERYRGPINMVTASVRNYDFTKALGHAMHRPALVPVPAFAIKAVVGGEFAESLLHGRRVMPAKLRELGFEWKYPTLDGALAAAV
jgi:uncharacterized protein (TIGR01777 family)